ncbi:hypothetical protein XA68_13395 [Ophiocordyceps unilateralis]|uniref:C2H2-type domain-containing protein n=1 Tax=Ophiocordyceps unilateralis TaxID=268505 RepID=A0A2A9PNL7_OPHUN|nr:hypothetical protein XA68_13395 [Ophiocordyceps unilateralis]
MHPDGETIGLTPKGSSQHASCMRELPLSSPARSTPDTGGRFDAPIKNGTKRKRDDDEDEESSDKNLPGRPTPKSDHGEGIGDEPTLELACPFYKSKPVRYRSCANKVLKGMARVKLHLWRCHLMPIHCAICLVEFDSEAGRDDHLRQQSCELREPRQLEGITEEQKKRLKRRVDTKKTRSEQWYDMFAVLFPDEPRPVTPFVERLVSHELLALQDFMTNEWPGMLDLLFDERLPAELRPQRHLVRAFSAGLMEELVVNVLGRLEAGHQPRRLDNSKASTPERAGFPVFGPVSPRLPDGAGPDPWLPPGTPTAQSSSAQQLSEFDALAALAALSSNSSAPQQEALPNMEFDDGIFYFNEPPPTPYLVCSPSGPRPRVGSAT